MLELQRMGRFGKKAFSCVVGSRGSVFGGDLRIPLDSCCETSAKCVSEECYETRLENNS